MKRRVKALKRPKAEVATAEPTLVTPFKEAETLLEHDLWTSTFFFKSACPEVNGLCGRCFQVHSVLLIMFQIQHIFL